jgi:competence protein ComEA
MKTVLYIVIGVLVGLLVAGLVWLASTPVRGESVTLLPPPTEVPLTVYVTGAVADPGLYQLPPGSRVNDAVVAAGGFTTEADTSYINLAALLQDGVQIRVPQLMPGLIIGGEGLLVNINTSTLAELDNLPGIGPTLAQKIIEYRQQYGFFATVDDIKKVPGIGDALFEEIKNKITTGN